MLNCLHIRNIQDLKPSQESSLESICLRPGITARILFTITTSIVFIFANFVWDSFRYRKSSKDIASHVLSIIRLEMKSIAIRRWKSQYLKLTAWRIRFIAKIWPLCPSYSWITRICTTIWAYSYSIYYAKFKMVNIILLAIFRKYLFSKVGKINWEQSFLHFGLAFPSKKRIRKVFDHI